MLPIDYTTVMARFPGSSKQYTYKTHIEDFKVGDQAVVDARGETKIVTITQVHKTPRLDPNAPYEYKWIICKVDRDEYKQLDRLKLQPRKATLAETVKALPSKLRNAVDFTTKEFDDEEEFDFAMDMDFDHQAFGDR
jgi:hypothetical protein